MGWWCVGEGVCSRLLVGAGGLQVCRHPRRGPVTQRLLLRAQGTVIFMFEFFLAIPLRNGRASVRDPDPLDPHVFGPPRSGSNSQRYGSGSGFFPFLKGVAD